MLEKGTKVHVDYEDAVGKKLFWAGTLMEPRPGGWLVDLGGIAIVFTTENIHEDNSQ